MLGGYGLKSYAKNGCDRQDHIPRMEKLEIFNTPTRFIGDSQTISLLVAHAFFKVNQMTGMIHCNLAGYPLRPAAPDSDLQSSLTEPLNAERTMALSSETSTTPRWMCEWGDAGWEATKSHWWTPASPFFFEQISVCQVWNKIPTMPTSQKSAFVNVSVAKSIC